MSVPTWREQLEGRIPPELGREIDIYETQIELRRQDKLDEKLFGESRLPAWRLWATLRQRSAQ